MGLDQPAGTETAAESEIDAEAIEELLVEDVSIDGMCGVY
ncbi:mycofactocin precursor MftA [Streptomyces agglomeratus]|nr:mycofactocin precursor MftA [Streptomyces agglomeratus]OEJ36265.1 mycofactocin precursor [Streptomyces agglomeratus]